VVLLSDHDEVPHPDSVRGLLAAPPRVARPHPHHSHHYVYSVRCRWSAAWGLGPVAFPGSFVRLLPEIERLRYDLCVAYVNFSASYPDLLAALPRETAAGALEPWDRPGSRCGLLTSWHLGTFVGPADVVMKLRSTAHEECNFAPVNTINWQRFAQCECLYFCGHEGYVGRKWGGMRRVKDEELTREAAIPPELARHPNEYPAQFTEGHQGVCPTGLERYPRVPGTSEKEGLQCEQKHSVQSQRNNNIHKNPHGSTHGGCIKNHPTGNLRVRPRHKIR
jgi:hypothetical protein